MVWGIWYALLMVFTYWFLNKVVKTKGELAIVVLLSILWPICWSALFCIALYLARRDNERTRKTAKRSH